MHDLTELPLDRILEWSAKPQPLDRALWKRLAELGWPGITIPEAHGGLGLGCEDLIVVFEEMGQSLAPLPRDLQPIRPSSTSNLSLAPVAQLAGVSTSDLAAPAVVLAQRVAVPFGRADLNYVTKLALALERR